MYRSLEMYLRDLERELRLLPAERRQDIIQQLRGDYEAKIAEQGAAKVLGALPVPAELAREFAADLPLKPAGHLRRILAFALDILVMLLPILAVLWLLVHAVAWQSTLVLVLGIMTIIGIIVLYFPLTEGMFGRTAGKFFTGLLVTREDGRPCGFAESFLRRIPFWFNLLLIDAIFALFLAGRQRAFDRVAKTLVVENPTKPRPWMIAVITVLLVTVGSLGAAVGLGMFDWFSGSVPPVPGDNVSVQQAMNLDLTEYGLQRGELDSNALSDGEALSGQWAGPGRAVHISIYRGPSPRTMLAMWTSGDSLRMMSRAINLVDRGLNQYRTNSHHKFGWYDGDWAVYVQTNREMFSPSEFRQLVRSIGEQLAEMN